MVPGKSPRRRAAIALLVAGATLGLGWAAYRASLDPWPARATLRLRDEWPLAFTPDGRSFATAADDRILVRDWDTGSVRASWPFVPDRVGVMGAFSPDGRTFAVAYRRDPQPVLVEFIDVATGRVRASGTTEYPRLGAFGFTPDGASVRVGSEDATGVRGVVSFDAATGAVEFACPPRPPAGTGRVATSLDGRFLIYADARGSAISIQEVRPDASLLAPAPTGLTSVGISGAVDCSRDGRTLAVGRLDGTIDLWDIPGSRKIRTIPHPKGDAPPSAFGPDPSKGSAATRAGSPGGWAISLAFGPDGRTLAAVYGNADEPLTARLLNAANGLVGRPVTPGAVELILMDCTTGRRLAGTPARGWAYFSRDGRMVATHHHGEHLLELRDVPPE